MDGEGWLGRAQPDLLSGRHPSRQPRPHPRVELVDWQYMAITFNHTIVFSHDKKQSATFLTDLFDLPSPTPVGPLLTVTVANGVALDYMDLPEGGDVRRQHYAFLVSEDEFDTIYAKIRAQGLEHWADHMSTRQGEINHDDGGKGVYFRDPSGHQLEILTRPYGSGR
jgi:catechol 2,3-dioxygenase-like lactoylglutathione lyase family enzyme